MRRTSVGLSLGVGLLFAALVGGGVVAASTITLVDGRIIQGKLAKVRGTVEDPRARLPEGVVDDRLVQLIDDGLRRTFVPIRRIREVNEIESGEPVELFRIRQNVALSGNRVMAAGPITRLEPFDQYGRRVLEMGTASGPVAVVQGITEITPEWIKVEGLDVQGRNYVWDMRIATSSLPRDTLDAILKQSIDVAKIDHRLKIVRLYLQASRFADAEQELRLIIQDFPDQQTQFQATAVRLHQAHARRILEEISVRRAAGQHALCMAMLDQFPSEDVAGETLQAVRAMHQAYESDRTRGQRLLEQVDAVFAQITDAGLRDQLQPIRDEIFAEFNFNTLNRLTAFDRFFADDSLEAEDKLALAISGWLTGSDRALRNMPVAISLFRVRNMVRQYLVDDTYSGRRDILTRLKGEEGASPQRMAWLLENMLPPLAASNPQPIQPGHYELTAPAPPGFASTVYRVQLPPDYDPHRRYPTIVTLHAAGTLPEHQIDWWAGSPDANGQRLGHAGRNGYIVIAPAWGQELQHSYNYGVEEHQAILLSLRDACRRFAVDTDRVFLSGHSMGGDAAWDIALAHPDLWAGVIPITARADKYIFHYTPNAEYVPIYFVAGELDGDKWKANSDSLTYCLRHNFNATVVEFLGRGHEHFSDEIIRVFDWMGRQRRTFWIRDFEECRSMRSWDTYFWWVELDDLPARCVVDPMNWPPPRNFRWVETTARVNENNSINVTSNAGQVTLWLSPELIDFNAPVSISVKGSRLQSNVPFIEPSVEIMLEDARTRADLQHPFWAKVVMPGGRINDVAESR